MQSPPYGQLQILTIDQATPWRVCNFTTADSYFRGVARNMLTNSGVYGHVYGAFNVCYDYMKLDVLSVEYNARFAVMYCVQNYNYSTTASPHFHVYAIEHDPTSLEQNVTDDEPKLSDITCETSMVHCPKEVISKFGGW